MEENKETIRIAYWPNDQWTEVGRGMLDAFMSHMGLSDDYAIIEIPAELTEEQIDAHVCNLNRLPWNPIFDEGFNKGDNDGQAESS